MGWEWLESKKVSHTKIVSLTQQLDKDKSILDLVAQSKKQQFLQTTYIEFLIFPENDLHLIDNWDKFSWPIWMVNI
jgi:hypothetical protein